MKDKTKISKLTSALTSLVDLKGHKDLKGKDEFYLIRQPEAWGKAREVLSELKKDNNTQPTNETIKELARKFMSSGKTIGGGDSGWIEEAFIEGANQMLKLIKE